jgi:hypothetical protein
MLYAPSRSNGNKRRRIGSGGNKDILMRHNKTLRTS